MKTGRITGVLALLLLVAAAPAEDLGGKVVAFCEKNVGQQIGRGECYDLAAAALKDAGARGRGKDDPGKGDYVWGELVYHAAATAGAVEVKEGAVGDLRPGDVIQFRDFEGGGFGKAPHHTAIVTAGPDAGGRVRIFHQNTGGVRKVTAGRLNVTKFDGGWVRVYRPIAK